MNGERLGDGTVQGNALRAALDALRCLVVPSVMYAFYALALLSLSSSEVVLKPAVARGQACRAAGVLDAVTRANSGASPPRRRPCGGTAEILAVFLRNASITAFKSLISLLTAISCQANGQAL